MTEKHIIFAKQVSKEELTKIIDLIHQLGFYVEVESLVEFKGFNTQSYLIRAIEWRRV